MKTPERRHLGRYGVLMLTLNILQTFSSVSIVDFEQVNIDWVMECGIKILQCTGSFIIHSEYNPIKVASVFLF